MPLSRLRRVWVVALSALTVCTYDKGRPYGRQALSDGSGPRFNATWMEYRCELYQNHQALHFNAADWQLIAQLTIARQHLQNSLEFQTYLPNVHVDAGVALLGQPGSVLCLFRISGTNSVRY